MPNERFPIRLVLPSRDDYRSPGYTGRAWDPIVPVDDALRRKFVDEIEVVHQAFKHSFARSAEVPAVARVSLRPEAHSKTKRPTAIFNQSTCPVIGVDAAGQLLVSVRPDGLRRVAAAIVNAGRETTAHVSVLESISPFEPIVDLATAQDAPLRVRLFCHPSPEANAAIDREFRQLMLANSELEGKLAPLPYGTGVRVYRLAPEGRSRINALKGFVGLQSISPFPTYGVVRTASRALHPVSVELFPPPSDEGPHGIVGVIDSGTDPTNPLLQEWVRDRYDGWVPRAEQLNEHGSFVAGLIANARSLNHGDNRFPGCRARIVDVVAFDRNNSIREDHLLTIIDDALVRYPEVRVWNLSLGLQGAPCCDDRVSDFAAALDQRAQERNVLFVLAAGNLGALPYRTWPSSQSIDDRLRPPADTVRALVVGGVAHAQTARSIAASEAPSPFSRKGPGCSGLLKPDLSHYAGNTDASGGYIQTGVLSLDGSGRVAEDVGTSFSAPMVSTIAAAVAHELSADPGGSDVRLVKALLLHATFVRNHDPSRSDLLPYCGLGIPPGTTDEILTCTQNSATLVFTATVRPGEVLEKAPFPMPPSMFEGGRLRGEIFMTLVADPPLAQNFGLEYCRSRVSVSLGVDEETPSGRVNLKRQVMPAHDHARSFMPDSVFKHGYKWSPVKHYYRKFSSGPSGVWRLQMRTLDRAEHDRCEVPVQLIVTLRARRGDATVYDEVIQATAQLGWISNDLQLRSQVRART